MDAFLAVEGGHAALAGSDGLAGAELDADSRAATLAEIRVEEDDVVGVAGRGLHLAAEQQGILMRHEQLAVIGDRRPAAALHERAVQRHAFDAALLAELLDLRLRESGPVIFFQRGDALVGRDRLAA